MIQTDNNAGCYGCGACAQVCPAKCIEMRPDGEGFLYPVIREEACVHCRRCEAVCPLNRPMEEEKDAPKAYAAYCLDPSVRQSSSSGGMFTLLAEYVLSRQGAVYGAAMPNPKEVKHIRVDIAEALDQLRGSKYLPSRIGDSYLQAEQDLKKGQLVLFTGTPCQIEGLYAYLGRKYENLISMDLICHGVPAPGVWEKYLGFRELTAESAVERVSFRSKQNGWDRYELTCEFAGKPPYRQAHQSDPFMQAFLNDLCLRPSCYQCGAKKINRISDFTAADFWGIQDVCPEMDDDKGTSLLLVHSEKGRAVFEEIRGNLCCREVDLQQALKHNPAMFRAAKEPKQRKRYLRTIQAENFEQVTTRCVQAKKPLRSMLKKMLVFLGLWTAVTWFKHRRKQN